MLGTQPQSQRKDTFDVLQAPLSAGLLQRKCDCGQHTIAGGECDECGKQHHSLQRSTRNSEFETRNSGGVPPIVHDVLRSPGQPLDPNTRAFFEPRFDHDFSRVRVHSDESSARSAQAVNALAYTVDHHVVFGAERYRPATTEGRNLLAHELAHVVQQNNGLARKEGMTIGEHNDAAEQEADATARAILNNQPASVSGRKASSLLQRQPAGSKEPVKAVRTWDREVVQKQKVIKVHDPTGS